jgi:indolepyruvate ferredoxin oxidoreductase alpha subunit
VGEEARMVSIATSKPGTSELLMGNEAIARGALEAGVGFAAAYPGTPSSEIIGTLAEVARDGEIYVEWSVNEKVAMEAAAAASFAGVRAIVAMKQNGVNVASDFLMNLNLTGTKAGLVLMACDDPSALSSTNEQDSRPFAKWADLPLLEPGTFQEAKDMTRWAFELSEEIGNVCMVRTVTRVSHARGDVRLGELTPPNKEARFTVTSPVEYTPYPVPFKHHLMLEKLKKAGELFESSPFNRYLGPERPELLLVTSGACWFYSLEAVKALHAEDRVGLLKLGTTWPLPEKLVQERLAQTEKVLVVEEVAPFLEGNLKQLVGEDVAAVGPITFFGKRSGHIPDTGELNPDLVVQALSSVLEVEKPAVAPEYTQRAQELTGGHTHMRAVGFCAGCPHRATLWSLKNALKLDGRGGFAAGDIGCYTMGLGPTGFFQIKTVQAMGSGVGVACGFGNLARLGFDQPVVAVCGDSTFFHAAIPALINGVYNRSNFTLLILDNSATAMTGFQPHAGTGATATGESVPALDIERLCRSMGVRVEVTDPFDIEGTKQKLLDLLRDDGGVRVLISKRTCELVRARQEKAVYRVHIDVDKCRGDSCGCARLCTRIFQCPGIIWNTETKTAEIDEVICSGCGLCADICPGSAIIREAT